MATKRIPKGPWDNGLYQNGNYDAVVHHIERGAYGQEGGFYFRFVLWLAQPRRFIVTNIYAKNTTATTALQRIWHFCQACGESDKVFYRRLHEFCAKPIRVRLIRVSTSQSGASEPYSDVDRFLRSKTPLNEAAWAVYREATGQKSKSNSENGQPKQIRKRKFDLFAV